MNRLIERALASRPQVQHPCTTWASSGLRPIFETTRWRSKLWLDRNKRLGFRMLSPALTMNWQGWCSTPTSFRWSFNSTRDWPHVGAGSQKDHQRHSRSTLRRRSNHSGDPQRSRLHGSASAYPDAGRQPPPGAGPLSTLARGSECPLWDESIRRAPNAGLPAGSDSCSFRKRS